MNTRIADGRNHWLVGGLALIASLLTACAPLIEKPEAVAWHSVYQPINDSEALAFLHAGIELLIETHGAPRIPIHEVLLRHSVKNREFARYRVATGFSKTEIVDKHRGVFCIYLAAPPSHERFYYLLGHEIGHLLRPEIVGSASEERFCNEFSRRLCAREHRPWSNEWETRDWVRLVGHAQPDSCQ